MNERQDFLRKTVLPSAVTTTIGVIATLLVKGNAAAAGIGLVALLAILLAYGLFRWVNPRLGFVPWLWLRQRNLMLAVLVLIAVTIWLVHLATSGRWLISPGVDTTILFWSAVIAIVLAGHGVSRLAPLIRPRRMPTAAGAANLTFAGKTLDKTSRGSTGPDGHPDAEFKMQFEFGSSAERLSVLQIVLQRVSETGRRLGQVWSSESLPSLWTLAVVDSSTEVVLNPDGRMARCSIQHGTVLRLFASDETDYVSAWFCSGQHYTATAYLEGGLYVSAEVILQ